MYLMLMRKQQNMNDNFIMYGNFCLCSVCNYIVVLSSKYIPTLTVRLIAQDVVISNLS